MNIYKRKYFNSLMERLEGVATSGKVLGMPQIQLFANPASRRPRILIKGFEALGYGVEVIHSAEDEPVVIDSSGSHGLYHHGFQNIIFTYAMQKLPIFD